MTHPLRWWLLVLAMMAGCKQASNSPTEPGPPVTTALTCSDANNQVVECGLTLPQSGGFTITLRSTDCGAVGNTLELTSPVNPPETLTTNGCYEAAGKVWSYPGPYEANSQIRLQITSPRLVYPPALRAKGAYPDWEIDFEDGGDQDFNDMILDIHAQ